MRNLSCDTFPTVILTCVPFTTIAHPSWDAPAAYWPLCPVLQSWTSLHIAQACRCKMPISRAAAASQRALCQGVLSDSSILHNEHCYVLHRWRNWASQKSRNSRDHRLQAGTARLEPRKPCLRPWASITAYSWVGVKYQKVYSMFSIITDFMVLFLFLFFFEYTS